MKAKNSVIATLIGLACTVYGQAADTYKIDPVHSSIGFSVKHLVISNVKGKFNEFSGVVELDNGAIKSANGTIQTKSIDTGVAQRDSDLRSANFFDVQKYPTITFQGKRVEKKGDQFLLIGDYTMHGVTKELTLPVTVSGPVKDPWGNSRIGLEARTKVNRKDYGMTYNKVLEAGGLMVGDEVQIDINAEAVKAGSPGSER
jgi:polyisoprenoid-binding protein YceI